MAKTVAGTVWKYYLSTRCNYTIRFSIIFICIKTNVGYMVVAEFITQSEDADHISEVLKQLQSWNPTWKPKFFMTDYSETELLAIEQCFPGIQAYLCDFHRE